MIKNCPASLALVACLHWRIPVDTKIQTNQKVREVGVWGATAATTFLEEFRRFALKGNVVDLAVGVIIGAAFAKIVDSLVKNIIMPTVSLLFPSDQSYTAWKFVVDGREIPYGLFLGEVANFLVVSLALFVFVVKFLGWVARWRTSEGKKDSQVPAPVTKEVELLTEIRDLLRAESPRR